MQVWELMARERIRDAYAAYTHAGDRGRLEDLAGTFTENGVLEIKGRARAAGRSAIIEMLAEVIAAGANVRPAEVRPRHVRHFVTNIEFREISRERAETSAYFLVVNDRGPDHWGRYRDVLVPVGDRWLFSERFVRIDDSADGNVN